MKRQQILKEHTGEEEDWAEEYRNQLWTARYGKRRLQKDEFVRCLMELKYLAEGTTLNLGGDRKKMGAQILSTLCLTEAMQLEEGYRQILLEELYNVFLKFIQVSRGAEDLPSWYLAWDSYPKKELQKKSPNRSARLPSKHHACSEWKKNSPCSRKLPSERIVRNIRIGNTF